MVFRMGIAFDKISLILDQEAYTSAFFLFFIVSLKSWMQNHRFIQPKSNAGVHWIIVFVKPNRPMTRSLYAQLLTNAENDKKLAYEEVKYDKFVNKKRHSAVRVLTDQRSRLLILTQLMLTESRPHDYMNSMPEIDGLSASLTFYSEIFI
ncbi:hypothetical protein L6164_000967 [Bauhinia variegata]|uniref:Uncharacterized protein n=1 Tax=Bauhinia variegata TaxID=167791 RepID=A0ACB9QA85_BAUVA|nr:hypothetical protein L6164_000967 [Bauhinia variegata]